MSTNNEDKRIFQEREYSNVYCITLGMGMSVTSANMAASPVGNRWKCLKLRGGERGCQIVNYESIILTLSTSDEWILCLMM